MLSKLLIATVLLVYGQFSAKHAGANLQPNLGDIRLKNAQERGNGVAHGLLQIYFTDGSLPPTWSSVCSQDFGRKWEGTTTCNQLGYQNCNNVQTVDLVDSDPVWLTDVNCQEQHYDHIFHCSHNLIRNGTCNKIIELYCDTLKSEDPYSGQVNLCAPDNFDQNVTYPIQSVSTGIVTINFYKEFGALSFLRNEKALTEEITHYRGNLICQQQGFQQVVPGSIQTVAAYKTAGYQFTKCATPNNGAIYVSTSWISNRNLTCESENYKDPDCTSTINDPCFSCCFTQPSPNSKIETDFDNYVVLQCIFDVYSKQDTVPYGTQSKCEFPSEFTNDGQRIKEYHTVCAAGSHSGKHDDTGYTVWTIISAFLIFFLIFTTCISSCYILINSKWYTKKGYDRVNGENSSGQQQPQNQQQNNSDK